MNDTRTLDPWALFVDERPSAPAPLVRVAEAPAVPEARIQLSATARNGVTNRAAEYTLDEHGITRRMHRDGGDRVTTIGWDDVISYRDSESTDHASLLIVGRGGARMRLHEADPSEETYQFIRGFVEYAEHRSPLQTGAGYRPGLVEIGVALIVIRILMEFLPEMVQGVGTVIALLIAFLYHSYTVLTDDDRAMEDRRSDALDARVRESTRRLLGIQSE
ncbi:hypothetical protein [Longimicrobium terrae]|uniref:Uncharacterized protein n=1 Tax=Longimicrobium terrae TaxID=1639882 RepID=A0A841H2R7_9BACT|nr:hypothetical protein [Longimicrobium terrae]MBB4637752.1 hypothetical protein [Longimicrobium terrae]MBB6072149.1 hypothetical protein [Longimicrobium terrae]NNC29772.1 hypothetical protein [Longimicrobium terrae]